MIHLTKITHIMAEGLLDRDQVVGAPAPGGREAAEPGAGKRRGAACGAALIRVLRAIRQHGIDQVR